MESLRSKPFWDRSPLESLADGYKKLPRNFKLCMLATFIIGLAAHMYCYTNMLTGADDSALFTQGFSWADGSCSLSRTAGQMVPLVRVGSLRCIFPLLKTFACPGCWGLLPCCYTALRHGLCARLCPSPLQQVLSLFPG